MQGEGIGDVLLRGEGDVLMFRGDSEAALEDALFDSGSERGASECGDDGRAALRSIEEDAALLDSLHSRFAIKEAFYVFYRLGQRNS